MVLLVFCIYDYTKKSAKTLSTFVALVAQFLAHVAAQIKIQIYAVINV